MFSFMCSSCTTGILSRVLDPSVPFIWIRSHSPQPVLRWWSAPTRLSDVGALHDVQVRQMRFDLQLNTARFLELLPELADYGMDLLQMARRVPDTLTVEGIAEEAVNQVLIQNGLRLRFNLPHAHECAQLASPEREVLVRILEKAEIREIAFT